MQVSTEIIYRVGIHLAGWNPINKSSHSAEQVLNKGAESKEAKTVSVTLSTRIQVHKVDLIKREYFWNPAISQMVEESVNTSEGKCEK